MVYDLAEYVVDGVLDGDVVDDVLDEGVAVDGVLDEDVVHDDDVPDAGDVLDDLGEV